MGHVFIGGIPASGKSYLAKRITRAIGGVHVELDRWRGEMSADSQLKQWVDFFADQNEELYWKTTTPAGHWGNLRKQCEALWPEMLKRIKEVQKSEAKAIFEGVYPLPHLAAKDLDFPGVYLLGDSFEAVFERNKKDPRWGKTETLQRKEAEAFFHDEGPRYRKEAEEHGYRTFSDTEDAEREIVMMLS